MRAASYRKSILYQKYGVTVEDYDEILKSQNGVCYICGSEPKLRRLAVDHEHIKGYSKLDPIDKRKYVRGLLCHFCNRFYMGGKPTVEKFKKCIQYIEKYGNKKPNED